MCRLLLVLIFLSHNFRLFLARHKNVTCEFLLSYDVEEYCRGLYPQEILIKYHDEWITIGERFVIYRSTGIETAYLIYFKKCVLNDCRSIRVLNNNEYLCNQYSSLRNETILVTLSNATGICYDFNLYLVDEMLRVCAKQNRFKTNPKKSSQSALLYYLGDECSGGDRRTWHSFESYCISWLCALMTLFYSF